MANKLKFSKILPQTIRKKFLLSMVLYAIVVLLLFTLDRGWVGAPRVVDVHYIWENYHIWTIIFVLLPAIILLAAYKNFVDFFIIVLNSLWVVGLCVFLYVTFPTKDSGNEETVIEKKSKRSEEEKKNARGYKDDDPGTDADALQKADSLKNAVSTVTIDSGSILSVAQKAKLQQRVDSLADAVQAKADQFEKIKQQNRDDQQFVCKINKKMEALRIRLDSLGNESRLLAKTPPSLACCTVSPAAAPSKNTVNRSLKSNVKYVRPQKNCEDKKTKFTATNY